MQQKSRPFDADLVYRILVDCGDQHTHIAPVEYGRQAFYAHGKLEALLHDALGKVPDHELALAFGYRSGQKSGLVYQFAGQRVAGHGRKYPHS